MKLSLCKWIQVFGIASSAALVACAPPSGPAMAPGSRAASVSAALMSGSSSASSASAQAIDAAWRCPYSPNVLLRDHIVGGSYDYTGLGNYTACVSRTASSRFRITGSATSGAICVYPFTSGASRTNLVEAPRCMTVTGAPIEVQFSGSGINYLVIVDSQNSAALNSCLSSTNPCPPRSEGFVQ